MKSINTIPPNPEILLLGAGEMADRYIKSLKTLGVPAGNILVLGRSRKRADDFSLRHGVTCVHGGIKALKDLPIAKTAIVAVSLEQLYESTLALLEKGYKYILLEKPGALYRKELINIAQRSSHQGAQIFIGFNRRFYSSVSNVQSMISQDHGALSCFFDFTEIEAHVRQSAIDKNLGQEVLSRWGLVNSLHIIDLAFFLGGKPQRWEHHHGGELSWHPNAGIFCGSGITERNVFFSYLSTWQGAGRWGIELTTRERKLILRPIETLVVQKKGQFQLETYMPASAQEIIEESIVGQVEAVLNCCAGNPADPRLCSIEEAIEHFSYAEMILGYGS